MTNYQNSVIYKLKKNDDYDDLNIYIGSTCNYKNRKYKHKQSCCNEKKKEYNYPVYQVIRDNGGWDMWEMIPIEEYPCDSKRELEIRERHHIDLLRPILNRRVPTRNQKERYENNREDILEKQKEWRKDNREEILEKKKQYYQNNREKIVEKAKQYNYDNKQEIQAKRKEYKKDNREKIAARRKQYRLNKKNEQDKDNNLSHEILEHGTTNKTSTQANL